MPAAPLPRMTPSEPTDLPGGYRVAALGEASAAALGKGVAADEVFAQVVGFDDRVPREFLDVPFFVGVAHTGYHVFPGYKGDVIEAHSTRRLDSVDNLEKSPFNPLATGGGPRWTATEWYRSGLVGLPPK